MRGFPRFDGGKEGGLVTAHGFTAAGGSLTRSPTPSQGGPAPPRAGLAPRPLVRAHFLVVDSRRGHTRYLQPFPLGGLMGGTWGVMGLGPAFQFPMPSSGRAGSIQNR